MHVRPAEYSDDLGLNEVMETTALPHGMRLDAENQTAGIDDVFDLVPSDPEELTTDGLRSDFLHPSDMPSLQREHSTVGYRDGIAAAKATSVQTGFDEGFSLGAAIGSRAGWILGVLEGIVESVKELDTSQAVETAKQLGSARQELSAAKIFSPEYWDPDGQRKFATQEQGSREADKLPWSDIAAAHPLLESWTLRLFHEAARWKLDLAGMRRSLTHIPEYFEKNPTENTVATLRNPLDW